MTRTVRRIAGLTAIAAALALLALPLRRAALRQLLATGISLPAKGSLGPLVWVLTSEHETLRLLFQYLYGLGAQCLAVSSDGHAVLIFGSDVQAERALLDGHGSTDGHMATALNLCLGYPAIISVNLEVAALTTG